MTNKTKNFDLFAINHQNKEIASLLTHKGDKHLMTKNEN